MANKLISLYRENRQQGHIMILILAVFLLIYFIPAGTVRFDNAILEAVRLTNWYAKEHVILCLLSALTGIPLKQSIAMTGAIELKTLCKFSPAFLAVSWMKMVAILKPACWDSQKAGLSISGRKPWSVLHQ